MGISKVHDNESPFITALSQSMSHKPKEDLWEIPLQCVVCV